MRYFIRVSFVAAVATLFLAPAVPALALFVPDRLFLFEGYHDIPGTTITPAFDAFATIPFPEPFVVQETNIFASSPPDGQEGGAFERNEYLARFKKSTDPTTGALNGTFGHRFQRSEAWDFAFDLKIESSHPDVRKEAGFYFEHVAPPGGAASLGNAILVATSNDTFYTNGPGEISTIYEVIPTYNFTNPAGPLGDYNHNGTVDAADYTIWRDTLGAVDDGVDPPEDMRANGNNDGASMNTIDQADYDIWKMNFGLGTSTDPITYTAGQTLSMRIIYVPPVLDPMIPFDPLNPGANVITPGTMEYRVAVDGGPMTTSGPLPFTTTWLGLPDYTLISARVQNLSTLSAAPDDSTVTFSNWDFNGDLPGTGLGAGSGEWAGVVPEPSTIALLGLALGLFSWRRQRGG